MAQFRFETLEILKMAIDLGDELLMLLMILKIKSNIGLQNNSELQATSYMLYKENKL